MRKYDIARMAALALMTLLPWTVSSCGTTTGNPLIQVKTGSYTARNWLDFVITPAYAATSNVKLCFQRMRFKSSTEDSSNSSGNVDFSPGEVALAVTGNALGRVRIPSGTYRRIEFDLQPNCTGSTSGASVQLTNSNGSFTSPDSITIKFEGVFAALEDDQVLTLGIQAIITQLNNVASTGDIKTFLEAAGTTGDF